MTCLPLIRPTLPPLADLATAAARAWSSGVVTLGDAVRDLEEEAAAATGARYAVAVSSGTAGLMLVPRALGLPAGSEVIVPSLTFAATVQALIWNGLVPVFCDCLPGTCTLDPEEVKRSLAPRTSAICAVTIYGLPPDAAPLVDIGAGRGIPVYFDSAQGLGATYAGRMLGTFGACEVFSLSPTKVVTAIEGGLITTNDAALAGRLRALRDYGKDPAAPDRMAYIGLSARMSELHASVGLLSLRRMPELISARLDRIAAYRARLGTLRGCRVQQYPDDRRTNGNYFVLFVTRQARRTRDEVHQALRARGIQAKPYFCPPVHVQEVFQSSPHRLGSPLPETLKASAEALALPLFSHMSDAEHDTVCTAVEALLG